MQISLNIDDHDSFPTLGEASSSLSQQPKHQQTPNTISLKKRIKPTFVSQNSKILRC